MLGCSKPPLTTRLGWEGSPGDSIFQDLATVPGQTYTLTFSTSSNGGPFADALTVEWDGNALATISTTPLGTWVQQTFSVTASRTTTRLEFVGHIGGCCGAMLDTVIVVSSDDNDNDEDDDDDEEDDEDEQAEQVIAYEVMENTVGNQN